MATYIQVTTPPTTPANAGELIREAEWGINHTLSNAIIQSERITESSISDPTQDQKGATCSELMYDKQWTLTLDFIGDSSIFGEGVLSGEGIPGNTQFSYGGYNWVVDSCDYTGTYNDKHRYSLTGHRFINFPAQS